MKKLTTNDGNMEELGLEAPSNPFIRKIETLSRRKIGVVFQDFKLLYKSTVYENVAFALEIFGLPKDEIHSKVLKVLDLVGLKKELEKMKLINKKIWSYLTDELFN